VALKTVQGRTTFNGGRTGIPCCRRVVAKGTSTKIRRHGEVAGLKNRELVMAGVPEEDKAVKIRWLTRC